MAFPKTSIVILCYGGWRDTIECLESLLKIDYPDYEIILVDNSSPDDSIQKIREYCRGGIEVSTKMVTFDARNKPITLIEYTMDELEKGSTDKEAKFNSSASNRRIKLIKNLENSGFAEGNNVGIRHALKSSSPEYVLLLNNDVTVDHEFLSHLISIAEGDETIGIAGPKIYFYDRNGRQDILHSIGGVIDYDKGWGTSASGGSEADTGQFNSTTDVDFVEGSCLLVKRRVIEEVGLLDSHFFLFWEECDFCARAKRKGYRTVFVPTSRIWHKIGATTTSSVRLYYLTRNRFWFMKKNASKLQYRRFILYALPIICASLVKKSLTGKLSEAKTIFKATVDGIIRFPSE